jgi:ABC-type phosphate/phosphonate transport system permease subunit
MLFLSLEAAWISFACGGLIGLFLWLTALGYQNKQVAKLTLIGILLNAILSLISAYFAFN